MPRQRSLNRASKEAHPPQIEVEWEIREGGVGYVERPVDAKWHCIIRFSIMAWCIRGSFMYSM